MKERRLKLLFAKAYDYIGKFNGMLLIIYAFVVLSAQCFY